MFTKVDKNIDTSKWENVHYGKGTMVKVEHATPFRSREAVLIRELLSRYKYQDDYVPQYNVIGDSNIVIKRNKLIVTEKSLLSVGRNEFKGNDLFANFYLHQQLNPVLFGYKKYGSGIYLRPILVTKTNEVKVASDITGVIGFQLLSRDNTEHNSLEPIFVRGVKRV